MKVWRRLQGLGAISLRNSVYVLPANEHSREDFQWLLQEIQRVGGEGIVCDAELVDGMRDDEIRALFDAARDLDYAELAKDVRPLKSGRKAKGASIKPQLEKLKQRLDAVAARDFFGVSGRLNVEAMIAELEVELTDGKPTGAFS